MKRLVLPFLLVSTSALAGQLDVTGLSCATYNKSYGSQLYGNYADQVSDLVAGRKFDGFSSCNKSEAVRVLCKRNPQATVGALMAMPLSKMPQVRCGA